MRRIYKLPDVVSISIRKNIPKNYIKLLQEYNKGIQNISETLSKRMDGFIKTIAPFNYGDLGGLHGRLKYDIDVEYKDVAHDDRQQMIKASVNSEVPEKAYVQEFGYINPTETSRKIWKAPFKPNPKRKKEYAGKPGNRIKGLGYLRVGMVLAAKSLTTDSPTIFSKPPVEQVRNYKNAVKTSLNYIVRKYTLAFAKGNKSGLPRYVTNRVQFPEESLVSKFTSNLRVEKVNLPLMLDLSLLGARGRYGSKVKGIGSKYRV